MNTLVTDTPLNGQFSLLLSLSVLINEVRLYPQIIKQTLYRPWGRGVHNTTPNKYADTVSSRERGSGGGGGATYNFTF